MMKRRHFLALCIVAATAAPAWSQDAKDKIIAQLRAQGFSSITVTRTWLGRTRITASSKSFDREVVMNSRSGEILRDYWEDKSGDGTTGGLVNPQDGDDGSGSESGSGGDNSGSGNSGSGGDSGDSGTGGGNSGPGGGGSGGGTGGGGGGNTQNDFQFNYLTGGLVDDIDFNPLR